MKRVVKEDIFGMANLYPKRTGLPVMIWVDNLGAEIKVGHNLPRLKVQNVPGDKAVDDAFVLSIDKSPKILSGKCKLSSKDFKTVVEYVSNHYDDFLAQWNQEINEDDLKERLYIH